MAKLTLYESFTNNSWLGLKSKKKKVSEAGLKDKLAKRKATKDNPDSVDHKMFDYYIASICVQANFILEKGDVFGVAEEDEYESWESNTKHGTNLDQDELDFKGAYILANKLASNKSILKKIAVESLKKGLVSGLAIIKVQEEVDQEDLAEVLQLIKKNEVGIVKEMTTDSREDSSEKYTAGVMLLRCSKGKLGDLKIVKQDLVSV